MSLLALTEILYKAMIKADTTFLKADESMIKAEKSGKTIKAYKTVLKVE